jgi:mannosyltransferase OCH1-like enzyme
MKLLPFILIVLFLFIAILVVIKFLLYPNKDLYNNIKNIKFTGEFKIPRILHQTYSYWDKLSPNVKLVIKENLKMNPGWEYRFYDNEAIDKYIKEHETDYVYRAYKKLNPKFGAAIADLFRYIVIYHEGGVYMDIKSKTNVPLDNWVHKDKLQVCLFGSENILLKKYFKCEKFKNFVSREIQQIFLVYPKNHDILRLLIDTISYNIHNYNNNKLSYLPNKIKNGYRVLSLTGPWIYTKILAPYICKNDCIVYNLNGYNGFYNGHIVYDGTDGEYHKDQNKKKIHYLEQNENLVLT